MHLGYGEKAMQYRDRVEAGQDLAAKLVTYANRPDVLVLGLPRGGVPVAFAVAERLGASLDVFVVRKLGLPGHEELAMGGRVAAPQGAGAMSAGGCAGGPRRRRRWARLALLSLWALFLCAQGPPP